VSQQRAEAAQQEAVAKQVRADEARDS